MNRPRTLEEKIVLRTLRKKDAVFLRGDFDDLGGYDQIGRVLKNLTDNKKMIRIGYGGCMQRQKFLLSPVN